MILYKTAGKEASAEMIVERSRFIAHVSPAVSRDEADAFIQRKKKECRDATHNVPAMVLGEKFQIQWASDDGEPQGTAGAPIVQMLIGEGITNTVIVVTRYFGGVKLGTGGLVRAYTGSAKSGLEAAEIYEVKENAVLTVKIDYSHFDRLRNMCDSEGFSLEDIKYEDKITVSIVADSDKKDTVKSRITNMTCGDIKIISEVLKNT